MIGRLEDFLQSILKYLARNMSKEEGSSEILLTARTRLRKLLSQVFEGILLPSSALCSEPHVIPGSLLGMLRSISETEAFLIVIDDDDEATSTLRSAINSVVVLPSGFGAGVPETVASSLKKLVDENGHHFERIAIIGALEKPPLREVLNAYADLPLFLFCIDYSIEYLSPEAVKKLPVDPVPIVNRDAELLQGTSAVEHVLSTLLFARKINIRETARLVLEDRILDRLDEIVIQAEKNLKEGRRRLEDEYTHLTKVEIFDHRSGAVAFSPSDWRLLPRRLGDGTIIDYFLERPSGYWQPGRPCFKRILFTPSRVLLRGEQYYTHMKNTSPIDRIREMLKELGVIQQSSPGFKKLKENIGNERDAPWKLGLAFLDQFRNIGLQFFSFAHATEAALRHIGAKSGVDGYLAESARRSIKELYDGEDAHLHSFVGKSVQAYYSWLLGDLEGAEDAFLKGIVYMRSLIETLQPVCDKLEELFSVARVDAGELRIGDLVRRWREADHPGENLLVALLAVEGAQGSDSVDAVGIGWGGIELPLVVRHLAKVRKILSAQQGMINAYIANWSHYRSEKSDIRWVSYPEYNARPPIFRGTRTILLDDNVLSGLTLEKIRNEMLVLGASDIHIYVTRFSGERRLAHMKMEGHGAIDPDFMLSHVKGYLGETPFSRSWSTKKGEYKSKVGVFSLARRRILECIHNNSTVEAWDREGF